MFALNFQVRRPSLRCCAQFLSAFNFQERSPSQEAKVAGRAVRAAGRPPRSARAACSRPEPLKARPRPRPPWAGGPLARARRAPPPAAAHDSTSPAFPGRPGRRGTIHDRVREFRVEPSPGISLRDVPARLPIAPQPRPATRTVAPTMLSAWCHGAEKGRRRVLATSVKGCVLDSEYDRKRAQCARDQFKEEASPRMLEPAAGVHVEGTQRCHKGHTQAGRQGGKGEWRTSSSPDGFVLWPT